MTPLEPRAEPRRALTAAEIDERFRSLQGRLVRHWGRIRELNDEPQTIVVVPSISLDVSFPPTLLQAYEERFLFILLLLRQPRAEMVYVTSQALRPEVVDYFVGLLPGVVPGHVRRRLHLLSVGDGSSTPLSAKLLARPRLLEAIVARIPDPAAAHLVPFNTTRLEKELAVRLGIPMYGCDPAHEPFGTKSGGRALFASVGVPHPAGREGLRSRDDLLDALTELRAERPDLGEVVLKLDESVSGEGNALLSLEGLPASGAAPERAALDERLASLRPESTGLSPGAYLEQLARHGGIAEERIVGEDFRSPSVQMRITPLGEVEVLSTHDQLLGGPGGQSYMGCRFPADEAYARQMTEHGRRIGRRLAEEGVLGRFAVDFVTARRPDGSWGVHAIELNLRKGGTTHPYLSLQFLTDGHYDEESVRFLAPDGHAKYYVSNDHVEGEDLKQLTPDDVFDFVVRSGLHFGQRTGTGVVLHVLSCVTEHGRVALSAVGHSHEEAWALHERAVSGLLEEAALAARRD